MTTPTASPEPSCSSSSSSGSPPHGRRPVRPSRPSSARRSDRSPDQTSPVASGVDRRLKKPRTGVHRTNVKPTSQPRVHASGGSSHRELTRPRIPGRFRSSIIEREKQTRLPLSVMLPPHHALATAILAIPLWRRGWSLARIGALFTGGVLMDVDHYLSYVWHSGDLSIVRAIRFHRSAYRSPFSGRLHPRWPRMGIDRFREFHSAPAIAAVFAVSFLAGRWGPVVRALAWGMVSHRILDEVAGWIHPPPDDRPGPNPGDD